MVRYQGSIRVVVLAGFTALYAAAWHFSGDDSRAPSIVPEMTERPSLIQPSFNFALLAGSQVGNRIGWAPRAVPEPQYGGIAAALGNFPGMSLAAGDQGGTLGQIPLGALLAQRHKQEAQPEVASSFVRPTAQLDGSWRRVRRYRNLPIDPRDDAIGAQTLERFSR